MLEKISDLIPTAPILRVLLESKCKEAKLATYQLISDELNVDPSNLRSTLLSDKDKYIPLLLDIEDSYRKRLLSWVDLSNRMTAKSKSSKFDIHRISPMIVGIMVIICFLTITHLIFNRSVEDTMRDSLLIIVGSLSTNFTNVVNYFLGSSRGSDMKDDTIKSYVESSSKSSESTKSRKF